MSGVRREKKEGRRIKPPTSHHRPTPLRQLGVSSQVLKSSEYRNMFQGLQRAEELSSLPVSWASKPSRSLMPSSARAHSSLEGMCPVFQCLGITILAAARKNLRTSRLIDRNVPGNKESSASSGVGRTVVACSLQYKLIMSVHKLCICGHSHQIWISVPLDDMHLQHLSERWGSMCVVVAGHLYHLLSNLYPFSCICVAGASAWVRAKHLCQSLEDKVLPKSLSHVAV